MNETSVKILILGRQLCERRCNKLDLYDVSAGVFSNICFQCGKSVSLHRTNRKLVV